MGQVNGEGVHTDSRRRRWNLEDKRAAVELSLDSDCNVAAVAACCGVSSAQIYAWRREVRELAEADARQDGRLFMPAVLDAAVEVVEPVPELPRGLIASVVAMLQRML